MLSQILAWGLNLNPLVCVLLALATVWYLKVRPRPPANIPPFPVRPYPVLGHIAMLRENPMKKFHEWKQATGDLFSLYLGSDLVIVLNSLEVLKEALVKQADIFSDRNLTYSSRKLNNGTLGIIGNSGASWKEQRSVSMSILRNFGMGKNMLAGKITDEVRFYLEAVSELAGQPTDIHLLTNSSVSNVICAILIGKRFEFQDPYFVKLIRLVSEQVRLLGATSILTCFPWLEYLPGDYFNAKKVLQNGNEIRFHFAKKFIQEEIIHEEEEEDKVDNFINAYHHEMKKKEKSNTPTYLDESNLGNVVSNLFVAGTETTSSTIMWALLFAIQNQQEQEKVYAEIVREVGTERLVSMQDRPALVFTAAFIMETQRLASIVPFGLSHLCSETTTVAGYTIPGGTTIIPNLDAVLKDSETWGDPLVFRPDRFLDETNKLVVPEHFVPFSLGRRYCMGESLAKMELFLFICGIFQRFLILPEDPENLPTQEPVLGITCAPKSFRSRLVQRW